MLCHRRLEARGHRLRASFFHQVSERPGFRSVLDVCVDERPHLQRHELAAHVHHIYGVSPSEKSFRTGVSTSL